MIIDASVAYKWLVEEPDSHVAIGWIGAGELNAPALLHAEVANALWQGVRRGELPGDLETAAMLGRFTDLITVIDELPSMPRALTLAIELDHAVYDCVYLALAEVRGEKLLTADEKFMRKAGQAGYFDLLQPMAYVGSSGSVPGARCEAEDVGKLPD